MESMVASYVTTAASAPVPSPTVGVGFSLANYPDCAVCSPFSYRYFMELTLTSASMLSRCLRYDRKLLLCQRNMHL